jgi:hypothetical protein
VALLPDDIVWQSPEPTSYPVPLPVWAKTMIDKVSHTLSALKWPAPLVPYVRHLPPYFQTRPAAVLAILIGAFFVLMIGGVTIVSCSPIARRLPAPIRRRLSAAPHFDLSEPRPRLSVAQADILPNAAKPQPHIQGYDFLVGNICVSRADVANKETNAFDPYACGGY